MSHLDTVTNSDTTKLAMPTPDNTQQSKPERRFFTGISGDMTDEELDALADEIHTRLFPPEPTSSEQ